MRMRSIATARRLLISLVATLFACTEPTSFENNGVSVQLNSIGLVVANHSGLWLAVAAFDSDILPLLDWVKCSTPLPSCLRLPPNGSLSIPFAEVGGDDGSGDIIVYAWTLMAPADALEVADVATIRVKR